MNTPSLSTPNAPDALSRRGFVGTCSAALFAFGFGLSGCSEAAVVEGGDDDAGDGVRIDGSTITLDLTTGQARTVAAAGGFLFIRSARAVIVNDGGTIRAFTSVCTHQGCDVDRFEGGQMVCPCHNSRFRTDGQVASGPAPSPLRAFAVTRAGDVVTIQTS